MSSTAAHLVDHVIAPDVTLRPWVLSVPFELRLLLAAKSAAPAAHQGSTYATSVRIRFTAGRFGSSTVVHRNAVFAEHMPALPRARSNARGIVCTLA
jgi:hypothetical protein